MAPAGPWPTAATPQRVAIAHFLQLLDVCGEDGFTLWVGVEDPELGLPSMRTLIVSPGITQLLGYSQGEYLDTPCVCELQGRCFAALLTHPRGRSMHGNILHPDDVDRVATMLAEAIASDAPEWRTVTCACLTKGGAYEEVTSHFTARQHKFVYSISTRGHLEGAAVDLRHLLTSTSFDLRCCATNIIGAASLLRGRSSVGDDDEGSFLADAVITSCGMLNGLAANVLQARASAPPGISCADRIPACASSPFRCGRWSATRWT